jgi:hypothetical protein
MNVEMLLPSDSAAAVNMWMAAWRNGFPGLGLAAMLGAEAALLDRVEATTAAWLKRRREAVEEAQSLMTEFRNAGDWAGLVKAQQAWVSSEFRRLSADIEDCTRLTIDFGTCQATSTLRTYQESGHAPDGSHST